MLTATFQVTEMCQTLPPPTELKPLNRFAKNLAQLIRSMGRPRVPDLVTIQGADLETPS